MLGLFTEKIVQTGHRVCQYILHRVRLTFPQESIIAIIENDAVKAILLLLSSLLFSLLATEHIVMLALTLALLSEIHYTHIQKRSIEKLQDEYRGQRAVNLVAATRHRVAYLALQQKIHSVSSGNTECTRAHYEHPSAELVRENRQLKERLHQLRLSGKTSTSTRTHNDRSTAEITCANNVLINSTRKLRATVTSLKSDVDHREKIIKGLRRSLETLHVVRAEENRDKDAAIEYLERSVEAAVARYSELSNELYRLTAAANEAEALAKELHILQARNRASNEEPDGGGAASKGIEDSASEDVDQQAKNSDFLQEGVDQGHKPLAPNCATVEDCDEEEEL